MGTRLGKYELGQELGRGGFGTIHVARDTELGRDVAIKLLRREHAFKEHVVQRFLQEARAAARINHPGIVTVFESGIAPGGDVYMAMELLAGETLAQRLRSTGRLPPGMAIVLARQMASALAAAHDAGIIHRDLKPANVFLVRDPVVPTGERVKILDFGIAKLVDDFGSNMQTHSMVMLGTPMYMSPEQCKSSAKVDARSDIYALGCMLFEMVGGSTPFGGDSGELIAKHQLVPPPDLRDLAPHAPEPLSLLVASMLAKSPSDRPPTMHAVVDTLDAIVSEPPETLERPASTIAGESQPKPPGRRRRLVVGGAAAAIALGVLTGLVASRHHSSPAARTVDAAQVAVAIDAAQVAPPPADAEDGSRIRMECLQVLADKHWPDAMACADRLAVYAPDDARKLKVQAAMELKSELTFDKLKEAVDRDDQDAARSQLDQIPAESVYRADAEKLLACDAGAERAKGENATKRGQHAAALAAFEEALACRPGDTDLEALAFMASCHLASLPNARAHYAKLPAAKRATLAPICVRNGIKKDQLEPAVAKAEPAASCDPKELEDKGIAAAGAGQNVLALASYERALECKGANPSRLNKLAFMAACQVKSIDKARVYWAKLAPQEQDTLAQMCERSGISRKDLARGCDAKELEDKAIEAAGKGQHQRALDTYEQAMTCSNAIPARLYKLAFMAACQLRSLPKARTYWNKLGANEQATLLQLCLRSGITKDDLDR